jgi:hypothetical protein
VCVRWLNTVYVHESYSSVQLPGLAEEFIHTNDVEWPMYLASDILGYFVFPERQRVYKSSLSIERLDTHE